MSNILSWLFSGSKEPARLPRTDSKGENWSQSDIVLIVFLCKKALPIHWKLFYSKLWDSVSTKNVLKLQIHFFDRIGGSFKCEEYSSREQWKNPSSPGVVFQSSVMPWWVLVSFFKGTNSTVTAFHLCFRKFLCLC